MIRAWTLIDPQLTLRLTCSHVTLTRMNKFLCHFHAAPCPLHHPHEKKYFDRLLVWYRSQAREGPVVLSNPYYHTTHHPNEDIPDAAGTAVAGSRDAAG